MKTPMKKLTYAAVIAAIYAALTLFLTPISFGFIQCRVSEALTILPVMSPVAVPGLFIGCLVANIYTGSIIDIIFGSLTTLLAAWCTYLTRKNRWVAMIFPVVFNAIVVGGYLALFVDKSQPVWLYMLSVGAGQAVACYGLGIPLHNLLKKFNF